MIAPHQEQKDSHSPKEKAVEVGFGSPKLHTFEIVDICRSIQPNANFLSLGIQERAVSAQSP